ncbi:ATP-binding protein [Pseudomonas profundi]|uniref:ATP-binding protein n=1 Tax=Pseudomonas profundi TaxID=1981513 RepID=UPI00123AD934|nr:ATP-binding protein [Pseudomonas profundi]
MSGLKSIILHHSYFRGLRVRIECDGHTNLQGTNGAGKTSALRLIPMFYGYEPNRLVDKVAGKDSFVNYYLPNRQSMLVFEYTRADDERCCAVMYRKEGDAGFAYRFVKAAADASVFHPDMEALFAAGEDAGSILRHQVPALDIRVSPEINRIVDFRSIIQNDPTGGGRRVQGARSRIDVRTFAGQFGLGSIRTRMQHIDALTTVSIKKDQMMARLKEMIVDSLLSDVVNLGAPPSHIKNEGLWSDLKSLTAFGEHEKTVKQALTDFESVKDNRLALDSCRLALADLQALGADQTALLGRQMAGINLDIEALSTELASKREALDEQISRQRAEVNTYNSQVQRLEAERDNWETERNIRHWEAELANLPMVRSDLDAARDRLQVLKAESENIAHEAGMAKAAINQQLEQDLDALETRQHQAQEARDALRSQHQQAIEALEQSREQQLEAFDEQLAQVRHECEALLEDAREQERQAREPGTTELEQRRSATDAVALAREHREQTERDVERLRHQLEQVSTGERSAEQHYERARGELQEAKARRDGIHSLLYPEDGTLLAYLRASGLPWHENLGKAINPALLTRTDLAPTLSGQAGSDVYGVCLDLDAIALPAAAESEAALQQQLSRAEQAMQRVELELGRCEEKWQGAQQDQARAKEAFVRARQAHDKAGERYAQAEQSAELIQREVKDSIEARTVHAAEHVRHLTLQTKDRISQEQQRRNQLKAQFTERRDALKRSHDEQLDAAKAALAAVQEAVDQRRSAAAQDLAAIEQARDERLRGAGVDVASIRETEQRVKSLSDRIGQTQSMDEPVREYRYWLKHHWAGLGALKESLYQAQNALTEGERQAKDCKASYNTRINALKDQAKQLGAGLKRLEEQLRDWEQLARSASELSDSIPVSTEEIAAHQPGAAEHTGSLESAALVTDELRRLIKATAETKDTVIKAFTRCVAALNQHPDSQVYQKWQHLHNARLHTSLHTEGSEAFRIESMADLRRIVEHDLPEIRKALIENVKSAGGAMARYYEELKDIDLRVSQVSRTLETRINTEHDFEAISDIRIRLLSRITQFDFWPQLKQFARDWHEWELTRHHDLPSETLRIGLSSLDKMFRSARMTTSDLGSLVELEIQFTENGRIVPIRNDNDLRNSSSTGLSSIAVVVIFGGLSRFLCPDESVTITWPIDELGELHPSNIDKLFRMMDRKNIVLLCAQPTASHEFLRRYKHRLLLSKDHGVRDFVYANQASPNNPLAQLLAGSEALTEGDQA